MASFLPTIRSPKKLLRPDLKRPRRNESYDKLHSLETANRDFSLSSLTLSSVSTGASEQSSNSSSRLNKLKDYKKSGAFTSSSPLNKLKDSKKNSAFTSCNRLNKIKKCKRSGVFNSIYYNSYSNVEDESTSSTGMSRVSSCTSLCKADKGIHEILLKEQQFNEKDHFQFEFWFSRTAILIYVALICLIAFRKVFFYHMISVILIMKMCSIISKWSEYFKEHRRVRRKYNKSMYEILYQFMQPWQERTKKSHHIITRLLLMRRALDTVSKATSAETLRHTVHQSNSLFLQDIDDRLDGYRKIDMDRSESANF